MPADRQLLEIVVGELASAEFDCRVFGGWAEELLGMSQPREHHDIDLLVVDPEMQALDSYLNAHREISAKRQSHKRAFDEEGVLIELSLVHAGVTPFWDSILHKWPTLDVVEIAGLRVAAREDVAAYRRERCAALHQRSALIGLADPRSRD